MLDKPAGLTSRAAVDRAARWFPPKTKIGHAGTLDPLATGVLVLAIGQATRLVEYVQAMPKVYRTRIVLGATSDTDDADGTVRLHPGAEPRDEATVRHALAGFVGVIAQIPPAYSAARVSGRRAHALARRGEQVNLAPRPVHIERIEVLSYSWPDLELEIHCGKGTYIRALARDLGGVLACGGYVAELRRLRIGPFTESSAVSLAATSAEALAGLLPTARAVGDMRTLVGSPEDIRRLRHGQHIAAAGDGPLAVSSSAGELIAVGCVDVGVFRPEKVLPPG